MWLYSQHCKRGPWLKCMDCKCRWWILVVCFKPKTYHCGCSVKWDLYSDFTQTRKDARHARAPCAATQALLRACVRLPNFVTIRQSHASGTQLAKTVIGLLTTSSPESHFRFHSINTGILKRFGRRRQERLWKKSKSCWLKRFEIRTCLQPVA